MIEKHRQESPNLDQSHQSTP